MKPRNTTTAERVRELLIYDPSTGVFSWRVRRNNIRAGAIAGNASHQRGYRIISIDKKRYLAHRLAWLYMTGEWPQDEIDHIDGQTDNNRLANLRPASRVQNSQNSKRDVGATSIHPGVYWNKSRGKWQASVRVGDGSKKFLGRYDDERPAALMYQIARELYHPYAVNR